MTSSFRSLHSMNGGIVLHEGTRDANFAPERQELAVHREEGVDGDEVEYLIEDIKEKLLDPLAFRFSCNALAGFLAP